MFSSDQSQSSIGADMTKEQKRPSSSVDDYFTKTVPCSNSGNIVYDITDSRPSILDPPYNLSERQLRHSNQSAGSYRGVPRSYAELITFAIESSPSKRLVLSDIYKWMYENVPEFVGM